MASSEKKAKKERKAKREKKAKKETRASGGASEKPPPPPTPPGKARRKAHLIAWFSGLLASDDAPSTRQKFLAARDYVAVANVVRGAARELTGDARGAHDEALRLLDTKGNFLHLVDTCVHRVLFRDEPAAAGNRLVADTLMTLQDLATARVPLSADATTVALSACRAFVDDINDADAPGRAAARLAAEAPPASDTATETAARGAIRLGGRTGYTPEKRQRVGADDAGSGSFYDRRGAGNSRRDARRSDERRKDGDWDCAECGFMNFASRRECYKCGAPGGGGGGGGVARRGGADAYARREDRYAPKPGDWTCPSCGFSNFASRVECKRCGEPGGGGGGGGGYGGGGWDRDARAVRSWSDDRGDRGFDRGFDRGARYGRGSEGGWSSRGNSGGNRRYGGGRGGRGGRDRAGGWDAADAGGWNDRNGDDRFGGY